MIDGDRRRATDLVAVTETEGRRLRDLASGRPDAPVPQYPGWTLLDLLVHTGSVHRRTLRVVDDQLTAAPDREYPPEEDVASVVHWYDEGLDRMTAVLRDTDPTRRVWGFVPDATVAFWRRRMALETSVHRRDAEVAGEGSTPLQVGVAMSGMDEYPAMWLPRMGHGLDGTGAAIALRAPIAGWRIGLDGSAFVMTEGDDPSAEATLTGDVGDLYLYLIDRDDGALARAGDDVLLDALDAAIAALTKAVR